jgi:hypothetical protein
MKRYGGVDVFLTSELVGGEWSASRPGRFTPGTHWIEGWVDARAGLEDVEGRKIVPPSRLTLRTLGRPALSQSQYRLSYPDTMHDSISKTVH